MLKWKGSQFLNFMTYIFLHVLRNKENAFSPFHQRNNEKNKIYLDCKKVIGIVYIMSMIKIMKLSVLPFIYITNYLF